jgi:flagellin-like hook-associated protein FlgL
MPGIIPIPTTRASDFLISQRLLEQLRTDQRDLLRIQNQLATGRRVFAPSDDAPAAQRGIVLQRLLEQKGQVEANRNASQSYLAATETALANVGGVLSDIRGLAVSLADTTTNQTQRDAAVVQIRRAIEQLANVGNQKFRGRYLFGGTRTAELPFNTDGDLVRYSGNEGHLQSFADVDLLVGSNFHGNEVFGALSAEVRGTADLNPILTLDTRLADLRAGLGIGQGSFTISDGVNTSTIDISSAETIGDVVRLIEGHPPAGRTLTARLTSNALSIQIDTGGGGNLTIRDAGGGTTAAELGIVDADGNGVAPIQGNDLNPVLRLTTRLADILGVRASTLVTSPAANNDLVIEFQERGAAGNGLTVQFVDDSLLQAASGVTAGAETATFSAAAVAPRAALRLAGADNDLTLTAATVGTALNNVRIDVTTAAIGDAANVSLAGNVLTIQIDSGGATTVGTLQAALALDGNFTAGFDTSLEAGVNAAATISAASAGIGVGNTGNSGGNANTLFINIDPGATTANHVVAAMENTPGVAALFTARLDGKDYDGFSDPGSGFVDIAATGLTTGGSGTDFDQSSGLQIVNGGQTYTIDLQQAESIEDLLNILNGSPAGILAEINASQTGINVRSRLSGSDFHIGENGGLTATHLGLRTLTGSTSLASLNHGQGVFTADGADFSIRRNDGVELEIDVSSAQTIQDVIDLINNHPDNLNPATAVVARLAQLGNGIELVDDNPAVGETLTVIRDPRSTAAIDLGLVPPGADQSLAATLSGVTESLQARDVNPLESKGAFNTLARLIQAVEANDFGEIGRAAAMLDVDLNRVTFARAEIGARQQSLDVLGQRLEDEQIELQRALSVEIDVDLVEAISELTARQASFQASLQTTAQTFKLTLLDYL